MLLVAFMFASVPLSSLDSDDDTLRTAIIKVKRLENSTQHEGRDFNAIFSNAVVALRTAAQFNTFIFPPTQNPETDYRQNYTECQVISNNGTNRLHRRTCLVLGRLSICQKASLCTTRSRLLPIHLLRNSSRSHAPDALQQDPMQSGLAIVLH